MQNSKGFRSALAVGVLTLVFAVGCGGETWDITAAVDDANKTLKENDNKASVACPDEVEGPVGTKFDCTLKGEESGKSTPVKFEIIKDGIDAVDQKDFESALEQVTKS